MAKPEAAIFNGVLSGRGLFGGTVVIWPLLDFFAGRKIACESAQHEAGTDRSRFHD